MSAFAASISIQLGGFIGSYKIDSGGYQRGDKTFSLSAGTHSFVIKHGGSTSFTVNTDGTITPANNKTNIPVFG